MAPTYAIPMVKVLIKAHAIASQCTQQVAVPLCNVTTIELYDNGYDV